MRAAVHGSDPTGDAKLHGHLRDGHFVQLRDVCRVSGRRVHPVRRHGEPRLRPTRPASVRLDGPPGKHLHTILRVGVRRDEPKRLHPLPLQRRLQQLHRRRQCVDDDRLAGGLSPPVRRVFAGVQRAQRWRAQPRRGGVRGRAAANLGDVFQLLWRAHRGPLRLARRLLAARHYRLCRAAASPAGLHIEPNRIAFSVRRFRMQWHVYLLHGPERSVHGTNWRLWPPGRRRVRKVHLLDPSRHVRQSRDVQRPGLQRDELVAQLLAGVQQVHCGAPVRTPWGKPLDHVHGDTLHSKHRPRDAPCQLLGLGVPAVHDGAQPATVPMPSGLSAFRPPSRSQQQ